MATFGEELIVEPPEVEVTEIPLEGEPPTDKAFETANGTKFRARIVKVDEIPTIAPVNGEVSVAPSGVTLSLTLALLDDNLQVATDSSGGYIITDRHIIGLLDAGMVNVDLDPAAVVNQIIRQQACQLEQRVANRRAVVDYFTEQWATEINMAPSNQAQTPLP